MYGFILILRNFFHIQFTIPHSLITILSVCININFLTLYFFCKIVLVIFGLCSFILILASVCQVPQNCVALRLAVFRKTIKFYKLTLPPSSNL